ncbi:hypothetical protein GCM10011290_14100 [Vogesella alkaliphila]|uniref:Uncharacterized protein n=1 Tax=Vogesella alkaliphila TaxID=1193621 RepID=A0ABQ2YKU1_9NEIS|nr:hypothetical protein GCM10011290_14100 [Vogesella alkaliphila]
MPSAYACGLMNYFNIICAFLQGFSEFLQNFIFFYVSDSVTAVEGVAKQLGAPCFSMLRGEGIPNPPKLRISEGTHIKKWPYKDIFQ